MIVYSCLYGAYDVPKPPVAHKAVTEWRLYTDDPTLVAPGWHVVVEPRPGFSPRMAGKYRKCHPPEDWEWSLYLDASVRLHSAALIDAAVGALSRGATWAMYRHPERSNIVDEADASVLLTKYDGQRLHEQVAAYLSEGVPDGLWAAGIIARSRTLFVLQAGTEWFEECRLYSDQDQISLPVVLSRYRRNISVTPLTAGGGLWDGFARQRPPARINARLHGNCAARHRPSSLSNSVRESARFRFWSSLAWTAASS